MHHGHEWLIHPAHDTPDKSQSIEIYSPTEFLRSRLHWNGNGGLLLHEYCHLIHQFCLTDGLENEIVNNVYKSAVGVGIGVVKSDVSESESGE